ncbi:MAG: glutaminyl-peptide cyclotransferase [Pseudomonadota bacterium]
MRRSRRFSALWAIVLVCGVMFGAVFGIVTPAWSEARYGYRIVNTYPHDEAAFTQGLFVEDGAFYESTGLYGQSSVRRVDIETGAVLAETKLPKQYFGEGAVTWGERLIMLTWRSGLGFVFEKDGLKKVDQFTYAGEGWGLTHNGEALIMSDGSHVLRFLDPESLEPLRTLAVLYRGQLVKRLNELEWVEGEIFANVWKSDYVVRIDPATGAVVGVIDFSGLLPDQEQRRRRDEVLNGVAYDAASKRLFITGKKWPSVFEVELVETKPNQE